MKTSINNNSLAFEVAAYAVLQEIQAARPGSDLPAIRLWANDQALASPRHNALHYLDMAQRAVVRGEPLPWLPAPSGLAPTVTHNEPT